MSITVVLAVLAAILTFAGFVAVLVYFIYRWSSLPAGPSLWHFSGEILGHRGSRFDKENDSWFIPENSLLSAYYAYKQGAAGIEVDVLITQDNQIIVMHDQSVDRMCEGTGTVARLSFKKIQSMQFKRNQFNKPLWTEGAAEFSKLMNESNEWLPSSARDINVAPSLEQIIVFCQKRNLKLMIETKEARKPTLMNKLLIQLYSKYNMYNWSYVATFNPLHLYALRTVEPTIPTVYLYCPNSIQNYHSNKSPELKLPAVINFYAMRRLLDWFIINYGADIIALWIGASGVGPQDKLINVELIDKLKQRGLICDVWTVNNCKLKHFLLEYGCCVTTDYLFNEEREVQYDSNFNKNRESIRATGLANLAKRSGGYVKTKNL
jgi:glycerophosphoryl diester phosphodiesterase